MIFVAVGMHKQGFDRLIRKMDEIAGGIDEAVLMQIGNATYRPKYAQYFQFIEFAELEDVVENARLVVCHGGAGTIITALNHGKEVIAVPRLQEYGEAVDDHQLELVDALASGGTIAAVYRVEDLDAAIAGSGSRQEKRYQSKQLLIQRLTDYIRDLEPQVRQNI